jgi:hypothetical protein
LARLDESIAAFNQRFIFPLPFAMKIIKINLWNQGNILANMAYVGSRHAIVFTTGHHFGINRASCTKIRLGGKVSQNINGVMLTCIMS